jgi:Autographiviridae endonuclease VII
MGRKRQIPLEAMCKGCGITFPLKAGERVPKYCTRECFVKLGTTLPKPHQKGKAIVWKHEPRPCIQCGTEYVPTGPSHKYCSVDCKRKWNLAVSVTLVEKACSICKEVKPIDQFTWIEDKGIYRSDCKVCVGDRAKVKKIKRREEHPELYSKRRHPRDYKQIARICEWCKETYYPKRFDQRFCGYKCSGSANIDRSDIPCKQCGKVFTKTGGYHQFCSSTCTTEWNFNLDMADKSKECIRCAETKPMSGFARSPKTGYYQSECIACMNKARDARAEAEPQKYERSSLRTQVKRFGISLEHYEAMLKAQNGKCWICGEEEPHRARLAIDHCHEEGYVRGLLCMHCNQGLGSFKDDVARLERAITYLNMSRELYNFIHKGEPLCLLT